MAEAKYIKIESAPAYDWLCGLIAKGLASTSPSVLGSMEYIILWNEALANPISLKDLAPPPRTVSAPKTQRSSRGKGKKKKVSQEASPYECAVHPTYGGKRRPRTDCVKCWQIFQILNPLEYPIKRRDFERSQARQVSSVMENEVTD